MSDDSDKPKTYRSKECYEKLVDSFSGPILDDAPVYEDKSDVPDGEKEYSVVASTDTSIEYGILMNELFATVAARCSDETITGGLVKGKVRVS